MSQKTVADAYLELCCAGLDIDRAEKIAKRYGELATKYPPSIEFPLLGDGGKDEIDPDPENKTED